MANIKYSFSIIYIHLLSFLWDDVRTYVIRKGMRAGLREVCVCACVCVCVCVTPVLDSYPSYRVLVALE